jgi:hypothetical protein
MTFRDYLSVPSLRFQDCWPAWSSKMGPICSSETSVLNHLTEMRVISWLSEDLLASQKGLCSMVFVS